MFSPSCLNDLLPVNYMATWLLSNYFRSCSLHIELIIPQRLLCSRCLANGDILRAIDSGYISLYWQCWTCMSAAFDTVDHTTSLRGLNTAFKVLLSTGSRLILMVAHNPISVALPLLPLVLCCAAPRSSGFGSWTDTLSFLYRWSFATDPASSITTTTTNIYGFCRPGDTTRLQSLISSCVCDVASWMQSNRLQLNTSSRKSSGARRSADSIWSQTRHLSLASTRLTSPQCPQPRHLHRLRRLHADPRRQGCIELFGSASDPQYSSDSQQTCSFVPCRRYGACQTGLR